VGNIGEELGLGAVEFGEAFESFAFSFPAVGLGDSVGDLVAGQSQEFLVGSV
jgi:hypothetical protein